VFGPGNVWVAWAVAGIATLALLAALSVFCTAKWRPLPQEPLARPNPVCVEIVVPAEQPKIASQKDCCICLLSLGGNQPNVVGACGHSFHRQCIDRWIQECRARGDDCPTCPLDKSAWTERLAEPARAD
jgi:hypothetical protein